MTTPTSQRIHKPASFNSSDGRFSGPVMGLTTCQLGNPGRYIPDSVLVRVETQMSAPDSLARNWTRKDVPDADERERVTECDHRT